MTIPNELQTEFVEKLLVSQEAEIITWSKEVLDKGMKPLDFFNKVFTPGMAAIGDKFARLDIFLPELMDSAQKAKAISDQVLAPLLAKDPTSKGMTCGKVVLASVKGDLHDIGKNMVSLMLQVNGFEVIDLGVNVSPGDIINRSRDEDADIVALSSLMTTSMPYMKEVVERLEGFGIKEKYPVIVGGAPITKEYAEGIGADAFGKDAIQAVQGCLALMDRPAGS